MIFTPKGLSVAFLHRWIFSRNSSTSDFSYDVWLGSDHLAYVNLKKDGSIVGKYRVNARGELEHSENSGWVVVSSTFTS